MQTWMITGISSGFGYEFAKQLLKAGERVIGTVRQTEAVKALRQEYPDTLIVRRLDIRDYDAVEEFVKNSFEEFGSIDVILSNSGIGIKGAVEEINRCDIENIISINLVGAIIFLRACVPYLKSQGYGRIVQMSSVGARIAADKWAYYYASKHGINGFCETLALELRAWNIHVNIIEPGSAQTDFWNHCKATSQSQLEAFARYRNRAEIDPERMVKLLISSFSSQSLPLHIVMGEDAYMGVTNTLRKDLREYEKQKELAKAAKAIIPNKRCLLLPETLEKRKLLMWGLGGDAENIFEFYDWSAWDRKLHGFVEMNKEKAGKVFIGREIFFPADIKDWSCFYVIIATTKNHDYIKAKLETYNLEEKKDFCYWKDLRKE